MKEMEKKERMKTRFSKADTLLRMCMNLFTFGFFLIFGAVYIMHRDIEFRKGSCNTDKNGKRQDISNFVCFIA